MTEKLKTTLGRVQETLLLPLVSRATETTFKHPILNDKKSVEILNQLDVNYKKLQRNMREIGIYGLCYRAYKMDDVVRKFLKKHPKGKILSIGAGLDTTYYRCDNGTAIWYDLDLPDSMELRNKLLPPPNKRVTYIAKSMFDYTWIDDLGDISGGLFIQIAGVLPYFKEKDVKALLTHIAPKLKGAEIMFDVISEFGKFFVNIGIKQSGMKEANLEWGVLKPKTVTDWSRHIELVKTYKFFKDMPATANPKVQTKSAMLINKIFDMSQMFHLRFV